MKANEIFTIARNKLTDVYILAIHNEEGTVLATIKLTDKEAVYISKQLGINIYN